MFEKHGPQDKRGSYLAPTVFFGSSISGWRIGGEGENGNELLFSLTEEGGGGRKTTFKHPPPGKERGGS